MRRLWIFLWACAWCSLGLGVAGADDAWRPVPQQGSVLTTSTTPTLRPKVRLGAPQSVHGSTAGAMSEPAASSEIALDQLGVFQRDPEIRRTYYLGQSPGCATPPPGYGGPPASFGVGPMTPEEQYNCGVVSEGPPGAHPWLSPFKNCWDRLFGCGPNTGMAGVGSMFNFTFQSDHAFDEFISPMTNPFFFEDPRSLTEARLIFQYQKSPSDNLLMRGGNTFLYTLQGRLAFNEYFSIVVHRLGFATVNPGTAVPGAPFSMFEGGTALADLQIGPKWTFYRNTQTQTIAALGANFEIPIGSEKVLNGNGAAVTPYLSVGQGFGNFHALGTVGYRFGFSGDRADQLFTSLHADYKIGTPIGAFYPLVELNWYYYTKNGSSTTDASNLVTDSLAGKSILTLGAGLRYKFSENLAAGVVYEFPLTGRSNSLMQYRIGVDLIFRY